MAANVDWVTHTRSRADRPLSQSTVAHAPAPRDSVSGRPRPKRPPWEPPAWTKEADPKSGHDYFLHAASGESRWELPAGAAALVHGEP